MHAVPRVKAGASSIQCAFLAMHREGMWHTEQDRINKVAGKKTTEILFTSR